MAPESFLLATGAFALTSTATAAMALRSPSRWRLAAPLSVALSLAAAYGTLDAATGTPKPVGLVPGWGAPNLRGDGATVLSATDMGESGIVLTLQEGRSAEPRLYRLPATDRLRDALKRAMERHAKANGGEKFGFAIKDGGSDGKASGASGDGVQGQGGGGAGQASPPSPYRFAEPVQPALPPKEAQP